MYGRKWEIKLILNLCLFQRTSPISKNHTAVRTSVKIALFELNKQLKSFSDCEKLNLSHINYAEKKEPFEKNILDKNKLKMVDYLVVFITNPGNAIFEATVRQFVQPNRNSTEKDFKLAGSISRLNMYGNQSYCVNDSKIKMYCYCKLLHLNKDK